jgi:ATP-dependent helicase/nuclease subunit A
MTGSGLDATARQRRAADPAASAWVAASAGSGKTKVLTDRVLRLLLSGSKPESLLCLTFTRAAAAEMSQRIAERLTAWATADDATLDERLAELLGRAAEPAERQRARRLLFIVLDTPGGLKIQTIHAFCQSLLARFPLEADTAPDFRVLTERDSRELLRFALIETIEAAERDAGPLGHALAAITWRLSEPDLLAVIRDAVSQPEKLIDCLAGFGSVEAAEAALRARLGLAPGENEGTILARAVADGAFAPAALRQAAAALLDGRPTDQQRGQAILAWLAANGDDRLAGFEAYAKQFLAFDDRDDAGLPTVRAKLATKEVAERAPEAVAALAEEGMRLAAILHRRQNARLAETSSAFLRLTARVLATVTALKRAHALVEFDDMIVAVRRLLDDPAAGAWVHFKLDGGLDHVLIDEAQDTSPAQWQIARALTQEFFAGEGARDIRRTVFAVGDIKQSIFSFQGAEPQQFLANRDAFRALCHAAHQPWHEVELPTSFRSTAAVLAAVDAVFATAPARDGVALDGQPIRHDVGPNRAGQAGCVELWPPLISARADDDTDAAEGIALKEKDEPPQQRLARLLADRIAAMITEGEPLPARGRPIRPGDVMVLVRRRSLFVEALVRELKERAIPVTGVDRLKLMEQMAVIDLVKLGHFVLLPEDDLTLAEVLKGPLIGFDDEALFRLCHDRSGSLWQALAQSAEREQTFAAAYARLEALRGRADLVTPFTFYSEVLSAGGGRRQILSRLGPDAEEPIAEFLQAALEFEALHPPSLQAFLAWMEAGRDIEIKRDLEQAAGAVRILTVHGAKGLQAPVVILPDTLQLPRPNHRLVWFTEADRPPLPLFAPRAEDRAPLFTAGVTPLQQAEGEEYRRLLYVAMTRAEDRLIVCGWRDRGRNEDPPECWYALVEKGLRAVSAPGLTLTAEPDPLLAASGLFADPTVLTLSCPQTAEVKAEAAETPPAAPPLPAWATQLPATEAPALRALAPSRGDAAPPVRPPLKEGGGSGLQRGRLIHRLLQFLPTLPVERRARAGQAWLSRPLHGLSAAEQAEILGEALAVLAAPELEPLFSPESLAEVPIVGMVAGRLIAGQVDRLVVTPERVMILDYKTDRPPPKDAGGVPVPYLRQMAAYCAVLEGLYVGTPVHGYLIWTCGPKLMALDAAILAAHRPQALAS